MQRLPLHWTIAASAEDQRLATYFCFDKRWADPVSVLILLLVY